MAVGMFGTNLYQGRTADDLLFLHDCTVEEWKLSSPPPPPPPFFFVTHFSFFVSQQQRVSLEEQKLLSKPRTNLQLCEFL